MVVETSSSEAHAVLSEFIPCVWLRMLAVKARRVWTGAQKQQHLLSLVVV